MTDVSARIGELTQRTIREAFAANPALARSDGDHSYDGVLPDPSAGANARRLRALSSLQTELEALPRDGVDADLRMDLDTAVQVTRDERFHLEVLRDPATDPLWALWRGADVSSYVARNYAPAHQRAESLARHLEQVPEWLEASAALLDPAIPEGPRDIAVESSRGHAAFYRDDVRGELGDLGDGGLTRRLDTAVEAAAAACERHAARLQEWSTLPPERSALGAERFCAMLAAQEGIVETIPSLRARADAELTRLLARGEELARQLGHASLATAFDAMEADHPTGDALLDTARGTLDALRIRWTQTGVVPVPDDVECTVRRTPSFFSHITAAYEPPGALDPPGMAHYYFVTPVDPLWSAEQSEQWLRHLNHSSLENISVHEVYPGHFVHGVAALKQPSLMRRTFWHSCFGEGWAHYTELLAVEQGFAEGKPGLELAMIQDALLRVCRFSACVGMHAEGMTLEEATRGFIEHAHLSELPAHREALRGTYDPMYLVYTYGKLEILRWREQLSAAGGFNLRRFHDTMLDIGHVPLVVVADRVLNGTG